MMMIEKKSEWERGKGSGWYICGRREESEAENLKKVSQNGSGIEWHPNNTKVISYHPFYHVLLFPHQLINKNQLVYVFECRTLRERYDITKSFFLVYWATKTTSYIMWGQNLRTQMNIASCIKSNANCQHTLQTYNTKIQEKKQVKLTRLLGFYLLNFTIFFLRPIWKRQDNLIIPREVTSSWNEGIC